MTEIKATVNGDHYRIEANNHADDSRVCTAVSVLFCTLSGAIANNPDAICTYSKLDPGHAVIEFLGTGDFAKEDFAVVLGGLLQVENSFPDFVKINQNFFE